MPRFKHARWMHYFHASGHGEEGKALFSRGKQATPQIHVDCGELGTKKVNSQVRPADERKDYRSHRLSLERTFQRLGRLAYVHLKRTYSRENLTQVEVQLHCRVQYCIGWA